MDADGTVNGHYLTVQAAASTDALARLAEDPTQPAVVRERAASELDGLDQRRPTVELASAARAAIARASTPTGTGRSALGTEATAVGAGLRLVAIKRYGLRAFLAMVEEMDGWWQHYDPVEIATGLSEEQWQRLGANLDASTAFIQAMTAARHAEGHEVCATDRPARAACS